MVAVANTYSSRLDQWVRRDLCQSLVFSVVYHFLNFFALSTHSLHTKLFYCPTMDGASNQRFFSLEKRTNRGNALPGTELNPYDTVKIPKSFPWSGQDNSGNSLGKFGIDTMAVILRDIWRDL